MDNNIVTISNQNKISLLKTQLHIYQSSLDALGNIIVDYLNGTLKDPKTTKQVIIKKCDEIKQDLISFIDDPVNNQIGASTNTFPNQVPTMIPISSNIKNEIPSTSLSTIVNNPVVKASTKRTRNSVKKESQDATLGYQFIFSDNSLPVMISMDTLLNNSNSLFTELSINALRNNSDIIRIDHPKSYFDIIHDVMKGIPYKQKKMDAKSKYKLYDEFEYYKVAVPTELSSYNTKELVNKKWKSDIFKVNVSDNIYKISKKNLKKRNIDNSFFDKRRDKRLRYDVDNDAIVLPFQTKYFEYIDTFIRTGRIQLKESDISHIKEIQKDFEAYGIPVDEKKWSVYSFQKTDMIGSDIISNEFAYYIHKWIPNKEWKIIYKGTKNGFSPSSFHKCCDNRGETLIVLYSRNNNVDCVFGGYTSVSWQSPRSNDSEYIKDPNAFLFTLQNPNGTLPSRYICKHPGSALVHSSSFGPIFGYTDICVEGELEKTIYINNKQKGKGYILNNDKQIFTCKNYIYTFITQEDNKDIKNIEKKYEFTIDEIEVFQSKE
ncbi:hypothetical protein WA158_002986 [Blastocystis sp. Blastoise]